MTEATPSRFSELFVIDSQYHHVCPSLPLSDRGFATEHAASFLTPGLTQHYADYMNVVGHESTFVEKRYVVGRVFVAVAPGYTVGTAFFVSPTILCTAGHVGHLIGAKYVVCEEYVPSLDHARKMQTRIYEVEEISSAWVATEKQAERQAMRLDIDPVDPHDGFEGEVHQIDFAFLRLKAGQAPSNVWIYPKWNFTDTHIAVLSYPTNVAESVLTAKNVSIAALNYSFGGSLGTRHVAPGGLMRSNGRIAVHTASTLKGSSGGPLVDPAGFYFGGIHIEGWDDVSWNLAVSVSHPVFRKAYDHFVVPSLTPAQVVDLNNLNA